MLVEQFNLYSLLIPFFLFGLSSAILIVRFFHKFPSYFMWYAAATFFAAIALLILNIIHPEVLPDLSFIPISFLLFACAMLSRATSLRLKLQTHTQFMLITIVIADVFYSYFSFIDEQYAARMLIMTLAIFFIFAHNFKAMFNMHLPHRLDRWLRASIILLVSIALLRSLYLFTVVGADNSLLANNLVSAGTQLIILFLIVSIAILLYGCTYQDIIMRLRYERNTDPLTGLLNRRAIFEHLEQMQADKPERHAVILCDIDFFKKINDVYGHHIGDLALQHVTSLLAQKVRYTDKVCRLGGEEFMIILQKTSKNTAICIAERLRQLAEITPFKHGNLEISITLSFGVSEFQSNANFDQTLQTTDLLLYQAKKFGRNKVEWQLAH